MCHWLDTLNFALKEFEISGILRHKSTIISITEGRTVDAGTGFQAARWDGFAIALRSHIWKGPR